MAYNPNFDERAATWDEDPDHVRRSRAIAEAIATAVPLSPATRMLEYGAGTGLVSRALQPHVGTVALADVSAGMRDVIRAKIAAGVLQHARVLEIDLSAHEPVPAERFDLIVSVLTLHHIDDLEPVLQGFAELLEPGGRVCIVDLDAEDGSFHGAGFHGHNGFERGALGEELETTGFARPEFSDCYEMDRHGATYSLFLAVAGRAR